MDDLKDAIGKTNELLSELIRRDDDRMKAAEAKKAEFKEKMGDSQKKIDEIMAKAKAESPMKDHDERMKKMREEAEETRRKHQEFNDEVVRMLNEQTALLTRIAEKLEGK